MFLILLVLGLILGSFINASVWRLHKQESGKKEAKYSITKGRSLCPHCKHQLAALDLIPLFSWIWLGGKCRYCHKKIGYIYPAAELITGLLFGFSYVLWPYGFDHFGILMFIFWLLFLSGFIALSIYDLRWRLLPNKIVAPLIALGIIQLALKCFHFHSAESLIVGVVWGLVLIPGLFYALYYISNGKWIGGGDIKLGIALALLVGGPGEAILLVFLASLLGSFISLPLLLSKKLKIKSTIPFGPLLMIAATVCYFYGHDIITWYRGLVG
jgi:prepilin signal peptidase PulO-like enzyme (type II secretory pathway)